VTDILHTMTWDVVMGEVIIPLLEDDAQLIAILGGLHIYAQDASRPITTPSIVWDLLDDDVTELFNPIDVQFDYFTRGVPNVRTAREEGVMIERRLHALLHWPTRRNVYDLNMGARFQPPSFSLDYPEPGVFHRGLRFTFDPARRILAGTDS
jgi:hypothetical protein